MRSTLQLSLEIILHIVRCANEPTRPPASGNPADCWPLINGHNSTFRNLSLVSLALRDLTQTILDTDPHLALMSSSAGSLVRRLQTDPKFAASFHKVTLVYETEVMWEARCLEKARRTRTSKGLPADDDQADFNVKAQAVDEWLAREDYGWETWTDKKTPHPALVALFRIADSAPRLAELVLGQFTIPFAGVLPQFTPTTFSALRSLVFVQPHQQ